MGIRLISATLVTAAILAVGCGSSDSTDTGSGSGDAQDTPVDHSFNGDWTLRNGVVDNSPLSPVEGHPITLEIDGDTVSGNAGCNGFGGAFSATDGELRIGDLAITEMACVDQAAMAAESAFVQGLLRASTIELITEDLVLGGDGVSLTFAPVAPIPDAPVIGTAWTLDTLVDGEAVSSTVADADPAVLLLEEGGRFTASTGCRDLAGDYTLDGDRLTLLPDPDLDLDRSTDQQPCDGPAGQQDMTVLEVVQQELTVEVMENRLTLTAADGTGLSYRTG